MCHYVDNQQNIYFYPVFLSLHQRDEDEELMYGRVINKYVYGLYYQSSAPDTLAEITATGQWTLKKQFLRIDALEWQPKLIPLQISTHEKYLETQTKNLSGS